MLEELKAKGSADPAKIEALAADPVTRSSLYDGLTFLKRRDLFPTKFGSLDQIAESFAISNYFFENGVRPELFGVLKIYSDGVAGKNKPTFVFRHRAPPKSAHQWQVVIVGPFSNDHEYIGEAVSIHSRLPAFDEGSQPGLIEKIDALVRGETVKFSP